MHLFSYFGLRVENRTINGIYIYIYIYTYLVDSGLVDKMGLWLSTSELTELGTMDFWSTFKIFYSLSTVRQPSLSELPETWKALCLCHKLELTTAFISFTCGTTTKWITLSAVDPHCEKCACFSSGGCHLLHSINRRLSELTVDLMLPVIY